MSLAPTDSLDINKSQSDNSGILSKFKSLFSSTEQTKSECDNEISKELYNFIQEFRNKLKSKTGLHPFIGAFIDYINKNINNKSTYKDIEKLFVDLYINDFVLYSFVEGLEIDKDIIRLIKDIYEYAFQKCNNSNAHHYKTLKEIQKIFKENIEKIYVNQTLNPSKPTPNPFKQTPTPSIQQSAPKSPIITSPIDTCDINNYIPRGLTNCGQSCYINSTLQSLLGIKIFRETIFNLRSMDNLTYYINTNLYTTKEYNKKDIQNKIQNNILSLLDYIICAKMIDNQEIIKKVTDVASKMNYDVKKQDDAQEFINNLINPSNLDLIKYSGYSILPNEITDNFKFKIQTNFYTEDNYEKYTKNKKEKKTLSSKETISFYFANTLNNSINDFIPTEITKLNDYYLNLNKITYKEDKIIDTPNILRISLGLFEHGSETANIKLINRDNIIFNKYEKFKINEPESTYNLSTFICRTNDNPITGHYWTYVKINNEWYKCNDSVISKENNSEVEKSFKNNCTVCFYEKVI